MIERLHIQRLGHRGDGIADTPAGPVYVPYTLPGETVEAEILAGHSDRRHLLRVEAPSSERIAPVCPHFGICGGCAIQHWTEKRYRAWKRDLVVQALAQMRIDAEVDELIDAHGKGRRRAVLHARRGGHDIVEVGFAGLRAHNIVAIDHCPVLAPSMASAIPAAWAIAEALRGHGKPLDIHATGTDTGLDIDVRGSGPLDSAQTTALARLAENQGVARITRHGELVIQRAAPTIRMGGVPVLLPPAAFLQATEKGEATLANLVAEHCGKAKIIADLFSGLGPFALRLAAGARITAVDNDVAALAALSRAAAAPGLKPIATDKRDLFRRPLLTQELDCFDAIIFDPPRQGAQAQAREIARS
jgi:23S rRNA (uracil1939-C5)-methyltransferase